MTLAQDRVLRGQCPNCGEEAAPYRLCGACRLKTKIIRIMRRGAKVGGFKIDKQGRENLYSIADAEKLHTIQWRADPKHDDRRSDPRLHGIRIDVEATLLEVVRFIGRPCTIEEITAAWGRLRAERTTPLPIDLARIIRAADKRKRKAEKAAKAFANQGAAA